jgi:hypothetical protein
MSRREHDHEQLLARVLSEFDEMPGLSLTVLQAAKLFALDRRTCAAILDELVRRKQLRVVQQQYRRA